MRREKAHLIAIALLGALACLPGEAQNHPNGLGEESRRERRPRVQFLCEEIPPPDGIASFSQRPWPNGVVPFEFIADIDESERADMLEAMDWWTTVAGVEFVFRTNEANFIRVQRSDDENVSSSSVGMNGDGVQNVNIWIDHWDEYGVVAHELCHALGFHHEQSRPDRDEFVRIEFQNIPENREHNFVIAENDISFSPYDYASIMHYGACSFSECEDSCSDDDAGCRSITTLDPDQQDEIGQRDGLSFNDIIDMVSVYGPRTSVYVSPNSNFIRLGTLSAPFGSIDEGLSNMPEGGMIILQGGFYGAPGFYFTPSTWRAHGGPAIIDF